MATSIRKGARTHLYIAEWIAHFGLSDEQVANRLDPPVARETVWRWQKEQHRLNPGKINALAQALGIDPRQFWRPPVKDQPSLDVLVEGAPDELRATVTDVVKRMVAGRG